MLTSGVRLVTSCMLCGANRIFFLMSPHRGQSEFRHTLKLSHSLQKELGSPYEHYLDYLLDITVGCDVKTMARDMFDTATIRNLDKSPRWVLWIRDSIWQKFKQRQAALREPCFGVTNSQFVRILLEMKRQLDIPVPAKFHLPHHPDISNETKQGESTKVTSRPILRNRIIMSPYVELNQPASRYHSQSMFKTSDLLKSHKPMHSSDTYQENITGKSTSLPNWLAMIVN
jgi:hypothetical protein